LGRQLLKAKVPADALVCVAETPCLSRRCQICRWTSSQTMQPPETPVQPLSPLPTPPQPEPTPSHAAAVRAASDCFKDRCGLTLEKRWAEL